MQELKTITPQEIAIPNRRTLHAAPESCQLAKPPELRGRCVRKCCHLSQLQLIRDLIPPST